MNLLAALLLLVAAVLAPNGRAAEAIPTTQDPVAAARAVQLAEALRCLVCQNQTIADSNADLAVDLRRQIREQIGAGRTDTQITQFMVDRYGDFVLYKPPLRATTLLLWGGPALLLIGGILVVIRALSTRRARVDAMPLSAEERARAVRLLSNERPEDHA
ncbi:MAG: cytochrome c-type biogenesis protein [Casimicrobiaceae bacterium]